MRGATRDAKTIIEDMQFQSTLLMRGATIVYDDNAVFL